MNDDEIIEALAKAACRATTGDNPDELRRGAGGNMVMPWHAFVADAQKFLAMLRMAQRLSALHVTGSMPE